jgi:hypothetical protein
MPAKLAALTDPKLCKEQGMNTTRLHKAIGITYKQICLASQVREYLEDMEKAHWIRAGPQQYLYNLNGTYLHGTVQQELYNNNMSGIYHFEFVVYRTHFEYFSQSNAF